MEPTKPPSRGPSCSESQAKLPAVLTLVMNGQGTITMLHSHLLAGERTSSQCGWVGQSLANHVWLSIAQQPHNEEVAGVYMPSIMRGGGGEKGGLIKGQDRAENRARAI